MNEAIKQAAKDNGIKLWEIADALKVSEFTFTRWMRHELPADKRQKVLDAIESLKNKKREGLKNAIDH